MTEPEQERPWAHLNNHYFMHTEKTLNPSLTAQMHLRNGVTDATNSLMDYMLSFSQVTPCSLWSARSVPRSFGSARSVPRSFGSARSVPRSFGSARSV